MRQTDHSKLPLEIAFADVPSSEDTILIDCRTYEEHEVAHLKLSICIPLQHLSLTANNLPCNQDDPIYVYCKTGNRSATFATYLRSIGFAKCQSIAGGFACWGES